MNKITEAAVREAASRNKALAKKAAEGKSDYWKAQFHWQVLEAHNALFFEIYGWRIARRAERLFYLRRPDFFDDEGSFIIDDYFDYTCFRPTIERIINRFIDHHPEVRLEPYDDLLMRLYPRQLKLFVEESE